MILDLKSKDYTEEEICKSMSINKNELVTLENDYARIVQKQ